ncbi:aldo-keto reductase [Apiospora phragmitis]|uniref:Aldo-keto reductase n=1 Tax=Apiospora phragmitis TaxID=2905665 RepID=A0ABR1URN0_9PEZI
MTLPQYFTLNNGEKVPAVALGTFQSDDGNSKVAATVKLALELGYRYIDGAAAYGNEKEIGLGIRESGVPRSDIYVISKLSQWFQPHQQSANIGFAVPHAYKADDHLQTIRHPSGNNKPVIDYELSRNYAATWKAMEALVESGKAKSIGTACVLIIANIIADADRIAGLSNFNLLKTTKLLETANIVPAVNQVELHPYLPQDELVEFSRQHGILVMVHQPLGGRPVGVVRAHEGQPRPIEDNEILEIATKLNKSPAQVCLSWAVQRGIPIVPKSVHKSRLGENLNLLSLPEVDFQTFNQLSHKTGAIRFLNPKPHIGFDIFDEENDEPVGDKAPWD